MSNVRPLENQDTLAPACVACQLTRRGFVSLAARAAVGVVVVGCSGGDGGTGTGPTGGGGGQPPTLPAGVTRNGNVFTVDLGASNDLTTGGVMVLTGGARPALLVRPAADTYVAFDARCPHEQATNLWSLGGGLLTCNNHGSRFGASDGTLANGPATRGLTTLPLQRTGNTLTVTTA